MKKILAFSLVLIHSLSYAQTFNMTELMPQHSLDFAWEIHYANDDMLWVTERPSMLLSRVDPDTGEKDVVLQVTDGYANSAQSGLIGLAMPDDFGDSEESSIVYVSYTYGNAALSYLRIAKYDYVLNGSDGQLVNREIVLDGIPAAFDHVSGRLKLGPDGTLYLTVGDQGANQFGNRCSEVKSQWLPSQTDVDNEDWSDYQGKILRVNPDGSIPDDNPIINGVKSHVYSYGHRNAQGIAFGNSGLLYSSEHGPRTDDEINLIMSGKNYGWPHVAGYRDDQSYTYCKWFTSSNCFSVPYDEGICPAGAEVENETDWSHPDFTEPIQTMFTVEDNFNFQNNDCSIEFICWPTVATSSIDVYESHSIPEWTQSLLIVSLKLGKVLRYELGEDLTTIVSDSSELFYTQNRYRDIAIHPNGKEFYVITDNWGQTSGPSGNSVGILENPGTILKFEMEAEQPVLQDWELIELADGFQFTEGPVWVEGQGLLFSDIPANKVYQYGLDSVVTTFLESSGNSNGLFLDAEDKLILAQHGTRQIGRLENGQIETVASTFDSKSLNSPNDLDIAQDGSIYFTDPPFGINSSQQELDFQGIYKIDPEGELILLDSGLIGPNGIVLSLDESILYASDSRDQTVYSWEVREDTLVNRQKLITVSSDSYLDGMDIDSRGFLYVTGSTGVHVIDPSGELIESINISGQPTNCTWREDKALYVTTDKVIYALTGEERDVDIIEPPVLEINEDQVAKRFYLYPNPANESFSISGDFHKIHGCHITDLLGNLVLHVKNMTSSVDISTLPAGVYVVSVETDKGRFMSRLIKE